MLAAVSHDLRQPLLAIRLFGGLLQQNAKQHSEADLQLSEKLLRASDNAVGMLDQFSEFSALEQGELRMRLEHLELTGILQQVAEQLRSTASESALQIRVYGRPVWVSADKILLSRVIQNLAGNAVRYSLAFHAKQATQDKSIARVVLAARQDANGVRIQIIDNGPGIAADKLDLVFEPYVQLQRGGEGFGLGLSIVKGIVQQLGWQILPVRSQVGKGTCFACRIPASAMLAPPSSPINSDVSSGINAEQDAMQSNLDGLLIAVLDDQDTAREAVCVSLNALGATVMSAGNSRELMVLLDEEDRFPDVLVFDYDLAEEQNGIDVIAQVRAATETCIPALILSGRVDAIPANTITTDTQVLRKPASLAQLSEQVQQLLHRKTQDQSFFQTEKPLCPLANPYF